MSSIPLLYYKTKSDSTEVLTRTREGYFYRSSSGESMRTDFSVGADGTRRDLGKSHYVKVSNGQKRIYSLNPNFRSGMVKQQLPYIPWRPADNDDPRYVPGKAAIEGLRCIILPIEDSGGNIVGKTWWALDVDDLMVETENRRPNARRVWELCDIQFIEPDRSKFGFPSDYKIDQSECRGGG